MTHEEAWEFGWNLPVSMWLNPVTGKPMMSRAEWEQLPRWRRIRDLILFRDPAKDDLDEVPPWRSGDGGTSG